MSAPAPRRRKPASSTAQRSTRQLDAVYGVLCASTAHPSAEQVFRAVRERIPTVSRGTVYRNLAKLVAAGRVRIVHVHDRRARYDARLDPHDHFQCLACTTLVDVSPSRRTDDVRQPTRAQLGGNRVSGRVVTWLGTCRTCTPTTNARRG
ncbi:transcriptional repressor [Candidatus Binatia bacterium]|nr:transcriptional repressor [Candidatus Binatia bacterium]